MGHTTPLAVDLGATQLLKTDLFVGHSPDHPRTSDKHVAGSLRHEGEIGDGRAVDSSSSTRPQDHRELGDDTGGNRVAVKDVTIRCQGIHTFLDACPTRVVQTDHGRAVGQRQIHNLADLAPVHGPHRTTPNGEILGVHINRPAPDLAPTGDHAVTQHIAIAMLGKGANLLERSWIQQYL